MKYRKLQITWVVAWGVVALLICVLWVRSSWFCESIRTQRHCVASLHGTVYVDPIFYDDEAARWNGPTSFVSHHWDLPGVDVWSFTAGDTRVRDPKLTVRHVYLVAACGLVSAAAWRRWRFSLRMMLIAMTLVAAGLGYVVWRMG